MDEVAFLRTEKCGRRVNNYSGSVHYARGPGEQKRNGDNKAGGVHLAGRTGRGHRGNQKLLESIFCDIYIANTIWMYVLHITFILHYFVKYTCNYREDCKNNSLYDATLVLFLHCFCKVYYTCVIYN